MRRKLLAICALAYLGMFSIQSQAQEHSVAREWNEMLLTSIRGDFARPTVHARNLFHISAAMYDAWAIYTIKGETYLIGQTRYGFTSDLQEFTPAGTGTVEEQMELCLSYVAARLLQRRFRFSPSSRDLLPAYEELLIEMGGDPNNTDTDYSSGSPAALG